MVVTNILDSSDAYRRGIRYGDEIVSFAGRPITSANAFKNMLGTLPKGWRVPITYVRNGQQISTLVRLEGVHRSEELLAKLQLGGIAPPPPQEPKEKSPREEDGKQPKLPIPKLPMLGKRKSQELDPKIAKVFDSRRGYANYYFNQQKQESIWRRLEKPADEGNRKPWRIEGRIGQRSFGLVVGDNAVGGRVKGVFEEVDFERSLTNQRSPKNSGGLLLALHQWRRLFVEGPRKFGDVYYLGTGPLYAPNASHPQQCDILVGTYDSLESRFYFHRESGKLEAMELYPDIDVDPCELHFGESLEQAGQRLPATIEVVHGDETYGTLTINDFELVEDFSDEGQP